MGPRRSNRPGREARSNIEVRPVQRLVCAGRAHELMVAAGLDDSPLAKHYDQIGAFHGGDSVSYDESGAVALQFFERRGDDRFGVGIEG